MRYLLVWAKSCQGWPRENHMKQLLTAEQVMDLFQISDTTLAEYRTEGMPFKKASERVLRYDAQQVNAWLQRRKTIDSAEGETGNSLATAPVSDFDLPPDVVRSSRETLLTMCRSLVTDPPPSELMPQYVAAHYALYELLMSAVKETE
jgi:predicted DNA-binding transcriptional regulator AlpA